MCLRMLLSRRRFQLNDNQILQCNLAAFGSCTKYGPDGKLGDAFYKSVKLFKSKIMKHVNPTGAIDDNVRSAIHDMISNLNPFKLKCKCGECEGFGHGSMLDQYRDGKPHIEAYCQYEYPYISHMTIGAAAGIIAMYPDETWEISSGYRCHIDNKQHGRTSTNHMGKAIDLRPVSIPFNNRAEYCDNIRNELVSLSTFQDGWSESNKLALEPSRIAPTWVHLDCRQFDHKWIIETARV